MNLDGFGVYTERFDRYCWGIHTRNDYTPGQMRQLSLDFELGRWGVSFFIRWERRT